MAALAVETVISQFPLAPPLRADNAVCAQRLNRCGECNALREGILCGYCGCFVQFRARIAQSHCPNPAGDRWLGIQTEDAL